MGVGSRADDLIFCAEQKAFFLILARKIRGGGHGWRGPGRSAGSSVALCPREQCRVFWRKTDPEVVGYGISVWWSILCG
ncbi:hypothetical protein E2562_003362 [Oryza meyeriana var. granulata]|uniref:Uncharacterized protein n=1 Tax=Oryza meyeriana var. granulata TaxID=110450 RepID=A0A6G1EDF7_9ORYZ|nr:hypothetical protein E2562_003362 [Oryza meyeriana var. granulata]